jgi:hypothetical protein
MKTNLLPIFTRELFLTVGFLGCLILPGQLSGQALINLDFGSGTATAKTGQAAFGESSNDFWNFYTRDDGNGGWRTIGGLANLSYADGTPSPAGVVVLSGPGYWNNGSSDPMYAGYIYPLNSGNLTVNVTNLPAASYDLYLYGYEASYQVTVGGADFGTKATTNSPILNPIVWQEYGQYVVIPNVAVAAGQTVTLTVRKGPGGYAVLSGMQIVQSSGAPPPDVPPTITAQPASQTVAIGSTVTFTVLSSGTPPFTYTWFHNGELVSGAGDYTLSFSQVQTNNSGEYQVVVSNAVGSATSTVATLTVTQLAPVILTQPQDQTVNVGSNALISVTASGAAPLRYQWLFKGRALYGATRSLLGISNVQPANAGGYSCRVGNSYGAVTSAIANLTVVGVAPSIMVQPLSQTVPAGTNLALNVQATGSPPLYYQWRLNGTNLPGATRTSLTLNNVRTNQSGLYSVVVTNWMGFATSDDVLLTVLYVNHPPVANNQALSVGYQGSVEIVLAGSDSDNDPLTYSIVTPPSHGTLTGAPPLLTYQPASNYSGQDTFTFKASDGQTDSAPATVSITVLPGTTKPLISVDFGAGSATAEVGAAAVGHAPSDFWNFYTRDGANGEWLTFSSVGPLKTTEGNETLAALTVENAPGAWGNGSSDAMYHSYIYPFDGGNVTVTVTNLEPAAYDFYLYGIDAAYELAVNGFSYGSKSLPGNPVSNPVVWQEGVQYVRFNGVYVGSGDSVRLTVRPGAGGYATISGMQIAQVDAPAAVPVTIVTQPVGQTVNEGSAVTLTIEASGTPPFSFQWRFNGTDIAGATSSALALTQVSPAMAGAYTVRVSNPAGSVLSAEALLEVVHVNRPPQAHPQSVSVPYNGSLGITLAGSDPENSPLTFAVATAPGHGTLSGNPPQLTYTAAPNYSGVDTFTFVANDGQTDSPPATVSITVLEDNSRLLVDIDFGAGNATTENGPAAVGHSPDDLWNFYTRDGANGEWLTFGFLSGLKTVEGALTSAGLTVANAPGAWGNGSADAMYNSYLYPFDGGAVTVALTNLDAGVYNFYIYGFDSHYELLVNELSYGAKSLPAGPFVNPVVWQEGVQYVLFKAVHVAASDKVTIAVRPGPGGYATISGLQLQQVDAPPASLPVITQQPASQLVMEGADVTFAVGVSGTSPFKYQWQFKGDDIPGATAPIYVVKAAAAANAGVYAVQVSNPAGSVRSEDGLLTVTPVNDAPTANAQGIVLAQNASRGIVLTGSDSDGDSLTFQILNLPSHGTLTGTAPDVTYVPATDFSGSDSFTFRVNDGQLDSAPAQVSIMVLGDLSKALINVDFGAGTSTTEAGPAVIGQSATDFWNFYSRDDGYGNWLGFGVLSNLKTADGGGTGAGLTVGNAPGAWGNGSADAMYNSYIYPFDGGNITVTLSNLPAGQYDLYVYGLDSSYQVVAGSADYGLKSLPNGPYVNPVLWQEGLQYVVFRNVQVSSVSGPVVLTVRPGSGGYATLSGMQIASVEGVNRAPVAAPGTLSVDKNISLPITLTGSDFDGDALTYSVAALPSHGILSGTAPNLVYTPFHDYAGTDHFTFVVSDGQLTSAPAAVNITVAGPGAPQLLNVDFGAGQATSKVGLAAVGQTSTDFWNFYTRDYNGGWRVSGTLNNLKFANGADSGADLAVNNADGCWGMNSTDPMYASYLYPLGPTGNLTVTLTNLPSGKYDLYVYGVDSSYNVNVDGADYGTRPLTLPVLADPIVWQEGGQYVLFTNIAVTPASQVLLTVTRGPNNYAYICGLQLTTITQVAVSTNRAPVARAALVAPFQLPGNTNLFVISGDGSNAVAVLDASLSSDPDNDPLQYNWFEGSLTPFGSGVITTNVFALGPHSVTLAVSDGQATATVSFEFEVITSNDALVLLALGVEQSALTRTTKRQLQTVLLENPDNSDADNLQAFQNKVQSYVAPEDPATASALTSAAQRLLNSLSQ